VQEVHYPAASVNVNGKNLAAQIRGQIAARPKPRADGARSEIGGDAEAHAKAATRRHRRRSQLEPHRRTVTVVPIRPGVGDGLVLVHRRIDGDRIMARRWLGQRIDDRCPRHHATGDGRAGRAADVVPGGRAHR